MTHSWPIQKTSDFMQIEANYLSLQTREHIVGSAFTTEAYGEQVCLIV